jgi:hypothetical protein
MQKLSINEIKQVNGGTSNDNHCDSFKKDLQDLLHKSLDGIGGTATNLSDKINELIDKHNKH